MNREPIDIVSRINASDLILGPTLALGQQGSTAILCGDFQVTFGELDAMANRVANALRSRLKLGDRVLMLLKDSPEFVAVFLGIMRCGCVAVPLNTRLAPRDLSFVSIDSEAAALLIDEEFLPIYQEAEKLGHLPPLLLAVCGTSSPDLVSLDQMVCMASPDATSEPMAGDDMAFWLYSSGTTGTPKAAIHCHGDVLTGDAYMHALGMGPGQRVFASSKLFFAFALGHTILGGLRAGATLVLYDAWPDAMAIAEIVERHRPNVMLSVPTLFRNLLRDGFARNPGFKGVRTYLSAGEALPPSLYKRWMEETGVPIIEGIGATETIYMFISGTPDDHRPGATGKPMPYAEVRLLDAQDNPISCADTKGIAWTKLPALCRGYWRQPEKTREAFRDGWYRTGDVFSVDGEGWWYYHGRSDDLLKISGQWVSPGEIEECAIAVHGILDAAVVGSENADGLVRMTLFLVIDTQIASTGQEQEEVEERVKHALLTTLSIYKCPRDIRFIEAIPRTATGKAQRYRLRELAAHRNT